MNALAHGQADALAHGCFSGSVTRTVHAKRREGKGPSRPDHTGPEDVGETWHHVVQLVTAVASAAPSRVETPDEMMALRAESLEHLDFTPDIPCSSDRDSCIERGEHPADWWFQTHCVGVLGICDRSVQERYAALARGVPYFRCSRCDARTPLGPYRILGPVR